VLQHFLRKLLQATALTKACKHRILNRQLTFPLRQALRNTHAELWAAAAATGALCCVQCKHQLAARLAFILKSCPVTTVTDAVLAEHLLGA
jgi:hypothetical protein